jgi:hypothetical protein
MLKEKCILSCVKFLFDVFLSYVLRVYPKEIGLQKGIQCQDVLFSLKSNEIIFYHCQQIIILC